MRYINLTYLLTYFNCKYLKYCSVLFLLAYIHRPCGWASEYLPIEEVNKRQCSIVISGLCCEHLGASLLLLLPPLPRHMSRLLLQPTPTIARITLRSFQLLLESGNVSQRK